MNCSQMVVWCWSYQRPSSWPSCQPWLRQWLEPLEPFYQSRKVRRTIALHQQHSHGSTRRYDRGQLLILFTTVKYQLGFLSVLASHVAFSIPIVVLMVLPRLRNEPGYGQCGLWLGSYPSANAQRDHVAVSDTSHYCRLLYGLYLFAWRLCRDLLCNRKWLYNLVCEVYSRARQGISLSINALSALVFLFSVLLVIGYHFITREKEEAAWKTLFIPNWDCPCHSDPLGISHQIEASMNTKNSDKLVIYNWEIISIQNC